MSHQHRTTFPLPYILTLNHSFSHLPFSFPLPPHSRLSPSLLLPPSSLLLPHPPHWPLIPCLLAFSLLPSLSLPLSPLSFPHMHLRQRHRCHPHTHLKCSVIYFSRTRTPSCKTVAKACHQPCQWSPWQQLFSWPRIHFKITHYI